MEVAIRSELLVKVALLDRAGADPRELLRPSTSGSPRSRTGWPAR
jgi:hypothetical protein